MNNNFTSDWENNTSKWNPPFYTGVSEELIHVNRRKRRDYMRVPFDSVVDSYAADWEKPSSGDWSKNESHSMSTKTLDWEYRHQDDTRDDHNIICNLKEDISFWYLYVCSESKQTDSDILSWSSGILSLTPETAERTATNKLFRIW